MSIRGTEREACAPAFEGADAGTRPSPCAASHSSQSLKHLVNVEDYHRVAQQRLPKMVYDYYASGAWDEYTLQDNMNAYARIQLRPRVLRDVSHINVETSACGLRLESPICIAASAMHKMACPEGEMATARAAASRDTLMMLSSLSTTSLEDVASISSATSPQWFQLYVFTDRQLTARIVKRAERAGYKALVLTVDAPKLGCRENDVRNSFALPDGLTLGHFSDTEALLPEGDGTSGLATYFATLLDPTLTWEVIAWLKSVTTLPIVVKGIQCAEDAHLAVEHGVAGIIVSNHGARQLDTVPATIDMLPEIVDCVAGRVDVFLDGGIRRGSDVLKALALGARAVFIGRPVLWGLGARGQQGVEEILDILKKELELAMALVGCSRISDLDARCLWASTTRSLCDRSSKL